MTSTNQNMQQLIYSEKVLVKHKHLLFFEPSLVESLMNLFFGKERQCKDSIAKQIASTMDFPKNVQANDF